ncbi:MAG TPA: zinc-dependent metalloprotease [Solirubrobacterales bacterium]|nr:zinc-dependent metalloprotease [Solirubrobacterales bacterium]
MSELVDWSIARRVARIAAGDGDDRPPASALRRAAEDSTRVVCSYTGLEPTEPVPEAEWVSRREWAAINLDSLRDSVEPLAGNLGLDGSLPGPLSGTVGGALGVVAGAQLGALVGYASRRVLGQYEFPVLGPRRAPRLLFVHPNVDEARGSLGGEAETVLRWIALHEVTHAVHLGSAPWLREHLRELASALLEGSRLGVGPGELADATKRVFTSDPRRTVASLWESDPVTLLTPPSSRPLLEDTQATMASIEGYAEHVMDAAAPRLGEEIGELRFAMERRREDRPPLARVLSWLLGMELKLRQYRDGKRFCDGVVELGGIEALNRAWDGPEALPALPELADPGAWLERCASRIA